VVTAVAFAATVAFAGCSSGSSSTASPTPGVTGSSTATTAVVGEVAPEGFTSVTLVVTAPDGSVREFCLWLADTPELRRQGLMGVTDPSLGGRDGMVFTWPADHRGGFWMKDTLLPLSIAWFAADGTFVADADMDPCPDGVDPCPSYAAGAAYRYAVEVPEGRLADLGLVKGSRVALGDACGASPTTAA